MNLSRIRFVACSTFDPQSVVNFCDILVPNLYSFPFVLKIPNTEHFLPVMCPLSGFEFENPAMEGQLVDIKTNLIK